jgi:concentrative nucleoside transporter, CNT family
VFLIYTLENARPLLGLVLIVLIAWFLSKNKRRFPVRLAVGAIAVQAVLVVALFAIPNSQAVDRTKKGQFRGSTTAGGARDRP